MQVPYTFLPLWGLITFGLAVSNLFLENSFVDEPESSTIFIDDVDEPFATDPVSDSSTLTDSNFLAESPDRCLSVLPPTSRIRRAQAEVCDTAQDGTTDVQNSAAAAAAATEEIAKYWCDTPETELLAKIAVCHPEGGDKMSSDHFLRKMQGYDFSLGFYETLFRCTLSTMYLECVA